MTYQQAVSGDRHCLQLIRRVTAVRGILRFRMECRPAFNYARDAHTAAHGRRRLATP
jgi:hypothetical protein